MSLTIEEAGQLVKDSLLTCYKALEAAGKDAKKIEGKQIDVSTKGDQIVGDAIINYLRNYKTPFVLYTEEKGKVELRPKCSHSIIFDDIDGTLNFKEGMGMLPFGTILGVFENTDPTFNDCIASGFLEYNSGNLFYANRGQGAYSIEKFARGKREEARIRTSGRKSMEGSSSLKLALDIYSLGSLAPIFAKYSGQNNWLGDFRCKLVHIAQIAYGAQDLLVFADNYSNRNKRSTAEELASGYLLVKEAGGSVLNWKGKDVGPEKVGLPEKRTFDIVMGSTEELVREFLKQIYASPEIASYMKNKI